jgi:hypothetical protein
MPEDNEEEQDYEEELAQARNKFQVVRKGMGIKSFIAKKATQARKTVESGDIDAWVILAVVISIIIDLAPFIFLGLDGGLMGSLMNVLGIYLLFFNFTWGMFNRWKAKLGARIIRSLLTWIIEFLPIVNFLPATTANTLYTIYSAKRRAHNASLDIEDYNTADKMIDETEENLQAA